MAYTLKDAEREVGDSKDWAIGLEASIKKWEQRVRGDVDSYSQGARCGVCFVADNRGIVNCADGACLANSICKGGQFTIDTPEGILQALKNLRKEANQMDCSKLCANFKPKDESPFPEGLKTEDLKVGMLVENNYGARYVILELLDDRWMKVLLFGKGIAHALVESLADNGCQSYRDGRWNQSNWLREVK